MSKLNKSIQDAYIRLKNEAVFGVYGNRYIPKNDDGTVDNTQDFPYLDDPTQYVTHVPLEQEELEEAEKEPKKSGEEEAPPDSEAEFDEELEASEEEAPEDEEMPEEETPEEMSDQNMDPEAQGGNVDADAAIGDLNAPGAAGPMGDDQATTATQLGRLYELKKIYSRLSSVEIFLSRTTDEKVLEIRKMVANAIDLFELVISNFEKYKDKIDEIIVTYYEFLKVVYESIRNNYRRISKQQE